MGSETDNPSPCPEHAGEPAVLFYEIRVKGCMDAGFWVDWFGEMECTADLEQAITALRGPVADQAELYGLLSRLRNKGLALISVQQIDQNSGNLIDSGNR